MVPDETVTVHPLGGLMQRFTVDWLDRADLTVPPEIMDPEYTIVIAGVEMAGREAYAEATSGQLARFPGLTITIHDAVYTPDGRAALRFTEHGASVRGGAAAWRGIGLFRARDGVLERNWCEEDYLGRRRQLLGGAPDPVDPPKVAPWTAPVADPDPDAEKAVRAWLDAGGPTGREPGIVHDDGRGPAGGADAAAVLDVEDLSLTELFSAGRRVAFHAVLRGRYAGGLPDVDPARIGAPETLEMGVAGLLEVADDGTLTGHVVRDRLGVHRALTR